MTNLVRAIKSLETLSLTCSIEMFPMDAIRKHDLRTFSLRDYEGNAHRPLRQSQVPTFSLSALLHIQSSCPKIMELALDLDQGMMVRKGLRRVLLEVILGPWKLIKSSVVLQFCKFAPRKPQSSSAYNVRARALSKRCRSQQ